MSDVEEQNEEQIEDDDEVDLEDLEADEDVSAAGLALGDDEEEDEDDALDDLLTQRSAGRRPAEPEEDEDDIMALAEREPASNEVVVTKVTPIKDRQEFVCRRCHLVKAKVQLADADRVLCRDCV